MRTTSGNRSSTASACPPRPRVKSTCTAFGSSHAGASSSRHRSSSTGTCVPRGSPMSDPHYLPTSRSPGYPVVRPYRQIPIRSCPLPAGAPEEDTRLAPGKRRQERERLEISQYGGGDVRAAPDGPHRCHALQSPGQHPLLDVGEFVLTRREVLLPGLFVPDLHPGARPDHHELAVQARVLPQVARDRHPALLVRNLVVGAREEHPAVRTGALVRHRCLAQLAGDALELGHREDIKATLLPLGDHDTSRQLIAELRRKDQPPLVVETRGVRAEEHRPNPLPQRFAVCLSTRAGRPPRSGSPRPCHCAPLYSTSLHPQPE